MQIVRIQTNIRNSDVPEKFEQDLSYNLSKTMDLPPDKFVIIVESALRMSIGLGSKETPIAVVEFRTTRPSSQSENDVFARRVTEVLREHLKLDPANIFVSFDFKDAKSFAVQGKTIASLYA